MTTIPGLVPDEVFIGTDGSLYVARLGQTKPTDADTDLPLSTDGLHADGWTPLGYTDENGVVLSESEAHFDVMAWQSNRPIRRVYTSRGETVKTALRQTNQTNFELFFGGGTTTGTPDDFHYAPDDPAVATPVALVVDAIDGDKKVRYYFAGVICVPAGDIAITKGAVSDLSVAFDVMVQAGEPPFEVWGVNTDFSPT